MAADALVEQPRVEKVVAYVARPGLVRAMRPVDKLYEVLAYWYVAKLVAIILHFAAQPVDKTKFP